MRTTSTTATGLMFLVGVAQIIYGSSLLEVRQSAQSSKAVVRYLSGNEPVKAVTFRIGAEEFAFGKEFEADQRWLEKLSINIQNSTGKAVTYIDVGLFFARSKEQEKLPPFHYSITLGNRLAALKQKESGLHFASSIDRRSLLPVPLPAKEFDSIQSSLTRLNYLSTPYQIEVQIEEVGFEDGTLWSLGGWYKPDPNDPSKLIRIKREKGSEKFVAFSTFDANEILDSEQCVSPIYAGRRCTNSNCEVRTVGQTDVNEQSHQVTQGYERCYIRNPDGSRGDYCGQDELVNLAPCTILIT